MQRSQENSVFVGNLGDINQMDVEQIFMGFGLKPQRIRVLTDDQGKSKGAAFVDFQDAHTAQEACNFDGREAGPNHRRMRINPAGSKPGHR